MVFSDRFSLLAIRVADPDYDPRHALLDVTGDLQALEPAASALPVNLQVEFRELLAEIRDIQPVFPSRRETSPLFDRSGLGRTGRERAERLVRRLVARARATARISAEESPPNPP